ncbi:MAG: aldo/keto reductase [Verrucomicrobiota bacterium]
MLERLKLPRTDLEVSQICLGTANFGIKQSEEDAHELLESYLEFGGNFIDTARVYSDWIPGEKGRCERIIGDWLRSSGKRDEVIIATKGMHYEWSDKSVNRVNQECARHDIELSLEVLEIETIDLYWLHRDKPWVPAEEIVDLMQVFIEEGKVRYLGVANWSGERLKAANEYALRNGLQGFAASQPLFNVGAWNVKPAADATLEALDRAGYDYHLESGVSLIPYSAQAQGFFTKAADEEGADWKSLMESRYATPRNLKLAAAIRELAEEKGCEVNGVVLGYLMSQPFAIVPIVGANHPQQLEDSVMATRIRLTEEELQRLDDISESGVVYRVGGGF